MTNGCLRALSRQKQSLRQPEDLATRYSHPQTLVELLQQSVGEEQIEAFLRADNEIAATCLQVNTLLSDAQEAEQALTQLGIAFEKHPWLDGCYLVRGTGNLAQLELFSSGKVYVQDPSARLAAMAAGAKPGMRVLDCCAAPGGKPCANRTQTAGV